MLSCCARHYSMCAGNDSRHVRRTEYSSRKGHLDAAKRSAAAVLGSSPSLYRIRRCSTPARPGPRLRLGCSVRLAAKPRPNLTATLSLARGNFCDLRASLQSPLLIVIFFSRTLPVNTSGSFYSILREPGAQTELKDHRTHDCCSTRSEALDFAG